LSFHGEHDELTRCRTATVIYPVHTYFLRASLKLRLSGNRRATRFLSRARHRWRACARASLRGSCGTSGIIRPITGLCM
jgi:hypothetical protein